MNALEINKSAANAPKKKKSSSDSIQAVAMLAPLLIGFVVFTYFPIIYILRFSVYNYNGYRAIFNGFANFERLFSRDPQFWMSIVNTLILSAGKLLIEIPLALLLAVLLNKALKGTGFFRVTLFLPAIMSTAIIGLIFSLMFAAYQGVINEILMSIGIIRAPVNWFGNKWTSMSVLATASIWHFVGINMVFFLMALQSVPKDLYECADIDGITPIRKFFSITLPMIGPVFQVVLLMAIVGSLKVSDLVLVTTNGQPGGSTEVVMTYVFKYFFGRDTRNTEVGYASAMSIITAIILAAISYLYMRSTRKMNESR